MSIAPANVTPSLRPGTSPWRVRQLLLIGLACSIGAALGIGAFTFRYAEGFSYFSTNPTACVNCHIMRPQFDAWQKSSHHAVAVCVDCHLPHDFVEPIVVQKRGLQILEDNCVRCHGELVASMHWMSTGDSERISCVRCHGGVGHGEVARLGGPLTRKELEAIEAL
jgi:cytochrome c nitrite reductase small subunit